VKHKVAVAAAIALAAAVYLLRLDDVAGLIKDDAWYLVLAKALATGQGFRLISSAATEILPAVPPGYPALLAPIFLIAPRYPENLLLLKAVSIIAMAIVGIACYVDFTRNRHVPPDAALALSTLIVLTPAFVFLATSTTMSECVFVAAQMSGVLAVERTVRTCDRRSAIVAGMLVALTCLVRTAGFALALAAMVYLVVRKRQQAAAYAMTIAVALLPWQVYAFAHQPTNEERVAHGGTIAYSYSQLVAMTRPASGEAISIGGTVVRAIENARGVVTRDIGAALFPVLYRGASESGEEVVSVGAPATSSMGNAAGTMVVSALLALLVLVGISRAHDWFSLPVLLSAASIGLTSLVGAQTFRYVLPLVPFLILYLWHCARDTPVVRVAVACLLALCLLDHGEYLRAKWSGKADWLADALEIEEVLLWLSAPGEAGGVASTNPGLVYLRTGRKGLYMTEPDVRSARTRASGVRYLAALQPIELPGPALRKGLIGKTSRRGLWVVEIPDRSAVHLTQNASGR